MFAPLIVEILAPPLVPTVGVGVYRPLLHDIFKLLDELFAA